MKWSQIEITAAAKTSFVGREVGDNSNKKLGQDGIRG
jgi:hypothetical protein